MNRGAGPAPGAPIRRRRRRDRVGLCRLRSRSAGGDVEARRSRETARIERAESIGLPGSLTRFDPPALCLFRYDDAPAGQEPTTRITTDAGALAAIGLATRELHLPTICEHAKSLPQAAARCRIRVRGPAAGLFSYASSSMLSAEAVGARVQQREMGRCPSRPMVWTRCDRRFVRPTGRF